MDHWLRLRQSVWLPFPHTRDFIVIILLPFIFFALFNGIFFERSFVYTILACLAFTWVEILRQLVRLAASVMRRRLSFGYLDLDWDLPGLCLLLHWFFGCSLLWYYDLGNWKLYFFIFFIFLFNVEVGKTKAL